MTTLVEKFDNGSRHTWSRKIPVSAQVISGLIFATDSLSILATGATLYFSLIVYSRASAEIYFSVISFVWITVILMFQFAGLYKFEWILKPRFYVDKMAVAVLTAFLFLLAVAFSFKISGTLSRVWIASFGTSTFASIFLLRLGFSKLAINLSARGLFTRNVIVVGDGEQITRLLQRISQLRPDFVAVTGVFTDSFERFRPGLAGISIRGSTDDVAAYVRAQTVDDVVVCLPWSEDDRVLSIIEKLRELPVNIHIGADLLGFRLDFRPPPGHFGGMPIFEVAGRPLSGWGVAIKICEDYVLGTLALALLLPFMGMIALAVRFDSPGPVLFRQKRLGFNNEVFEIYKFRTMYCLPENPAWTIQATPNDPRITRLGGLLRRWSLDELPQLFNVINGSMSLVGPRPHAVDHNQIFSQQIRGYFARHRVKPGITGWAQVRGFRGETNTPEKLAARIRHDIQYAENWSLLFDLRILIKTLVVCIGGRNAY